MLKDFGQLLGSVRSQVQGDLLKAHESFTFGCQNLPELNTRPDPAKIIVSLEEKVRALTNLPDTKFYSSPALRNYEFPYHNFRLSEASRTFTTQPHAGFYDVVVGLHIFSSNRERNHYYYAISTFQPIHRAFPQLEDAQNDPFANPKHLMDYSGLQLFTPEEIPPEMLTGVIAKLQRVALL